MLLECHQSGELLVTQIAVEWFLTSVSAYVNAAMNHRGLSSQ